MEFWDYDLAPGLGADLTSLTELQAARARIEAEIASLNLVLKVASGDEAKMARKQYIELTKARDVIYGKIKARSGGVLPPLAPTAPTPPPAPRQPTLTLAHGACYDGPVPKGHFKRGEQAGSEEPFTLGTFLITRSPVCDSGWMTVDPTKVASPAPRAAGPVVVRRKL